LEAPDDLKQQLAQGALP